MFQLVFSHAPSPCTLRFISLVIERNADHDPAHDIIYLEIALRAIGMCVVAPDTGLRDSPVGVDRLKKLFCAAC